MAISFAGEGTREVVTVDILDGITLESRRRKGEAVGTEFDRPIIPRTPILNNA